MQDKFKVEVTSKNPATATISYISDVEWDKDKIKIKKPFWLKIHDYLNKPRFSIFEFTLILIVCKIIKGLVGL